MTEVTLQVVNIPLPDKQTYCTRCDCHLRLHHTNLNAKIPFEGLTADDENWACTICFPTIHNLILSEEFHNFWTEWMSPVIRP